MQVGDYVRTKNGIILKIKDIEDIYTTDNEYIGMAIYDNEGHFVNDVEIIKSDPKLIKLVQVGDYVNGKYILNITDKGKYKRLEYYCTDNWELMGIIFEKDIKSIVTKEQFENMEYKVGE